MQLDVELTTNGRGTKVMFNRYFSLCKVPKVLPLNWTTDRRMINKKKSVCNCTHGLCRFVLPISWASANKCSVVQCQRTHIHTVDDTSLMWCCRSVRGCSDEVTISIYLSRWTLSYLFSPHIFYSVKKYHRDLPFLLCRQVSHGANPGAFRGFSFQKRSMNVFCRNTL